MNEVIANTTPESPILLFLFTALTSLGVFIGWLVKQIIQLNKESATAMVELKNVVQNNNDLIKVHLAKEHD